jgi:small subunit ribosomal protein S27Ae
LSKQQPAPAPPVPAPVPGPEAPPVEEKKPEKKEKPKAPKRRIQVHKLYKVGGEKLTRLRKDCPRCGAGYFMAQHGNRLTCGHCGYTTYLQKS